MAFLVLTVTPTLPPKTIKYSLLQTQTTKLINLQTKLILPTQNLSFQTRLFSIPPKQPLLRQRFKTVLLNINRNNNFNRNQLNRRTDQIVKKFLLINNENQGRQQIQDNEKKNQIIYWQNQQSLFFFFIKNNFNVKI